MGDSHKNLQGRHLLTAFFLFRLTFADEDPTM